MDLDAIINFVQDSSTGLAKDLSSDTSAKPAKPSAPAVPSNPTTPAPSSTSTPTPPLTSIYQDEDEENAPYGFYNSVYARFTTLSDIHCVEHRVPWVKLRHRNYSWCVLCHRDAEERSLQESIKKSQALEAELTRRGITYQEWIKEQEKKHAQKIQKQRILSGKSSRESGATMSAEETEDYLEQLLGFYAYAFDETTYRPVPIKRSAAVIRHILHPNVHHFRKSLGLLFYGAAHTGKTLTALLIIRTWARLGKQVHYLTFSDLRNQLVSEGFKTKETCLHTCKNAEILIIDDIDYPRISTLLTSEVRNILHHRSLRLGITIFITRADCSTLKEWKEWNDSTAPNRSQTKKAQQPRELVNIDTAKLKKFKPIPFGNLSYPYLATPTNPTTASTHEAPDHPEDYHDHR